jgi:hypothetical protein
MPRGGQRRNAGRPPKSARTERVWVRIRPELLDEIERLAAAQGREPGQLLSLFVETGMMVWAEDAQGLMSKIFD